MKTISKMSLILLTVCSITACNANNKKQKETFALNEIAKTGTHKTNKQYVKVALLLDTSNSMDGLIDQAKAQLWEIVNELSYAKCNEKKPNLLIALYEYGNARLNANDGYVRQVLAFSSDLDEISKQLFSLTTNGGDEYCGYVINTALDQLEWDDNPDDLKFIFIAGNEPFTQGKINYKDAAKRAHNKDITVNTIFCGNYAQGLSSFWKDGADLAHGDYMAIDHNQETVHISTPYDDIILKENKKLNETYVAYGKIGREKMNLQAEQDTNAEAYSSANAVSRTVSKSSHLYKNAIWDLVDASKETSFDYKNIDKSKLPEVLRSKSEMEIKTYISQKKAQRETIQNKIQTLNTKRMAFILEANKGQTNNLEQAMIKAIKTQGEKKNYHWK
ncbi:VWA domain-containing protein [Lacinutrix neustonica]|uniref:VWA domain-containing protein n=1 Tax=Lacinutrix neustonica TaxID=2980107 RepID=A0A9E8MXV5_9FLAO|nr:vWA domain-containing protein [Lacinutrix neustonica]WAC03688.1 VWA domain-containing protein [Lacinutrix neustonica]